MPRFYRINFYQNRPKTKLILPKNTKFRALGALPPDPVPRAAGGFAPDL